MSYTSLIYLVFLSVTCLVYYLFPQKVRWVVLFIANIVFYAASGLDNLLYIAGAIIVTYVIALQIGKLHKEFKQLKKSGEYDRSQLKELKAGYEKRRKKFLVLGLITVISGLGIIKYTNFLLAIVSRISLARSNAGRKRL